MEVNFEKEEYIDMYTLNDCELEKTNVKSEFIVSGDYFSPEEFTRKLQIIPDKVCKKGEKVNHGNKVWEFSRWMLFTEYEESFDINEQLGKIFYKLIDKRDLLRELKEEMDLYYVFDFAVIIENQVPPAIYFEQEFIDFCRDIGAVIDVDTYVN